MTPDLKFVINGVPMSKQSARVRIVGNYARHYQPTKTQKAEQAIAADVLSQLPRGFKKLDCPLGVRMLYVFPPLKSWSKAKLAALSNGETFYKATKPDLTDNLNKGLFDAAEGIVYTNDSRICEIFGSKKIYGLEPRTELEIFIL